MKIASKFCDFDDESPILSTRMQQAKNWKLAS